MPSPLAPSASTTPVATPPAMPSHPTMPYPTMPPGTTPSNYAPPNPMPRAPMPQAPMPETAPPIAEPHLHYPTPPSKFPPMPPPGQIPTWQPGDGTPPGYDSVLNHSVAEGEAGPSGGGPSEAREPELEPLTIEEGGGHSQRELFLMTYPDLLFLLWIRRISDERR